MKSIKNIYGIRYRLTADRLSECEADDEGYLFSCRFAEMRVAIRNVHHKLTLDAIWPGQESWACFCPVAWHPGTGLIGCTAFSPTEFAKILKAAGIRKTKQGYKAE